MAINKRNKRMILNYFKGYRECLTINKQTHVILNPITCTKLNVVFNE